MKAQLINLGYGKNESPSYTLRFTVDRKKIPAEFYTKDSSNGSNKPLDSKVAGFLGLMGLSSINEEQTFVITKSQKNVESLKAALLKITNNAPETVTLIAEFDKLSPTKGTAVWVKGTGDSFDKTFGIDLIKGLVPVITRTNVDPQIEAMRPVTNPSTKEVVMYKGLPVWESTEIGYDENGVGTYAFEEDFVWSHLEVSAETV
jgi:hypothetical protein